MAALLKLRNFQFRFIDFLARGVGKSSRNATAFEQQKILWRSISEETLSPLPFSRERIEVRGCDRLIQPSPFKERGE
jgi:hypothetical protein